MGLFTEDSSSPYSIFQRKEVFNEDYTPNTVRGFPHREKEINKLVEYLKPVLDGHRSNVVVYGPQGCGKTAVISFILNSIEETNTRAIHIDCWQHDSPQAVLHMIGLEFGTLKIARRGISTSERIFKLNKTYVKKPTVVVLDNAERLLSKDPSTIMNILEIRNASLILIVNNLSILDKTESRIMAHLKPSKLKFKPYTLEQIQDILGERISQAFDSGSMKGDLLKEISRYTFMKGGDIRLGINALLKTGYEALTQGSEFIELKHFEAVKEKLIDFKPGKLEYLTQHERDIIKVLQDKGDLEPEELYMQYKRISANSLKQRQFYIYLERMLNMGLIKSGRGKLKSRQYYGRISLNEQGN